MEASLIKQFSKREKNTVILTNLVAIAPALWPISVTRFGFPPNAWISRCIQCNPKRMSEKALFFKQ